MFHILVYFSHCFFFLLKAAVEAPDVNYKSIKTTKIKLEDNATCNIGVHFDLVADKIGKCLIGRGFNEF